MIRITLFRFVIKQVTDNQWLGASVFSSSTSGVFGACAPRYTWKSLVYNGNGTVRERDLDLDLDLDILSPRRT